jgi:hypothetical protein
MFAACFNPNLFLKKFPEERDVWKINQQRIKGFLKFTASVDKNVSSINLKAARQIKKLNDVGFVTVDSQEGIHEETKNPKYVYGEQKGQPVINKEGSPAVLSIVSERGYCDGFIRTELLDVFEAQLKVCNPQAIVLRYPRETGAERVNLTKEYIKYEDGSEYKNDITNSPEYTLNDLQTYIIDVTLRHDGYYTGPPLPPMPIDLRRWTYILAIDMEYGHHVLEKDGLFVCMEKALIAALKSFRGGKRRTMKKRVKALRNNRA